MKENSLFTDDMIVYVEKPKQLELIDSFNHTSEYSITALRSVVLLYISNKKNQK